MAQTETVVNKKNELNFFGKLPKQQKYFYAF
jgi:hypothetical protein